MSGMLEGKSAFVTGAGSGIGRATAVAMAREGAKVLCADLSGADETAAAITVSGGEAYSAVLDVTDEAAVNAAVDGLVAKWGRLDIGFNTAGINIENKRDHWDRLDLFDKSMEVNVRGVMICMLAELRHMYPQRSGSIVNTASTAALQGIAYTVAYAASKHGVMGVTKSLAIEFASKGVRVNAVAPGFVDTPMGNSTPPEGEVDWSLVMRNAPKLVEGTCAPSDIADTIAFMASDQARKMTGTIINVDGGQLAG